MPLVASDFATVFDRWLTADTPTEDAPVWAGLKVQNDLSHCLWPLLQALAWTGHRRNVAEALPHFIDELDLTGFLNTMAALNFRGRCLETRIDRIDRRLLPCLFLPRDRAAVVVLSRDGDRYCVHNGASDRVEVVEAPRWRGRAFVFASGGAEQTVTKKFGWFAGMGARFSGPAAQVFGLTFLLNVLALAAPLLVMGVYDRVIAAHSAPTLAFFALGMAIALVAEIGFRTIRARVLAHVGARLDLLVGTAVFRKILFLPVSMIERSAIGAQLARLRDFDSVRDFFTGSMALILLELPFVVLFLGAMALIGGPLVLVPLAAIAIFAAGGAAFAPVVARRVASSARAAAERQNFLTQTLTSLRSIKYSAAEATWRERYRDVSGTAVMAGFRLSLISALIENLAQTLMVFAGLSTLIVGVHLVLDNALSVGALIASMILVWRALAPLQILFVTLSRWSQVRSSVRQIDQLMLLKPERDPDAVLQPLRKIEGRLTFNRVSLRYESGTDPALAGVDLEIPAREIVAVLGADGAGKSSLLKVILGLYQPQVGNVALDGRDIRQTDPIELRHLIGYLPESPQFFYGSLAQNLRLAQPDASDDDLLTAIDEVGLIDAIRQLPDGLDTRLGDARTRWISTSLLQQLSYARALVKRPPVLLLDEPGRGLDGQGDQRLVASLERRRGRTTIVMVTSRPSHIRLADKVLWLDGGQVRAYGPAGQVRPRLPQEFQ